ncbi:MAG: hypothetical protein OEY64_10245 [Nitrospinota bacterium]|nr:hypothetical protein [Nitrospinota bacterium]
MYRFAVVLLLASFVLACASPPPKKEIDKERIKSRASETMEKIQ